MEFGGIDNLSAGWYKQNRSMTNFVWGAASKRVVAASLFFWQSRTDEIFAHGPYTTYISPLPLFYKAQVVSTCSRYSGVSAGNWPISPVTSLSSSLAACSLRSSIN